MPKQLLFSDQARNKLLSGVNQLAKAVITTLGPRGRNVALDKNGELHLLFTTEFLLLRR